MFLYLYYKKILKKIYKIKFINIIKLKNQLNFIKIHHFYF